MVDVGLVCWGPVAPWFTSGRYLYYALDDSDDHVGATFAAPKTGNITHVGLRVYSVTGTPPDYNVAVVTITESTGVPTNTAYGGGAAGTLTGAATGWHWVALATPSAVTAGDKIAVNVWPTGSPGNPDGSNKIAVGYGLSDVVSAYPAGGYGGSATIFSSTGIAPTFAIRYSDGMGYGGVCLPSVVNAYDSDDTPDEVGVKITLPFSGQCVGCSVGFNTVGANASWTYRLENAAGDLLASWNMSDEDIAMWPSATYGAPSPRWAPISLAADTVYYLSVRSTHASATIAPYGWEWTHASEKDCFVGGGTTVLVYRTDGGEWTEDSDQCAAFGLLFNDITIPEGGEPGSGGAFAFVS